MTKIERKIYMAKWRKAHPGYSRQYYRRKSSRQSPFEKDHEFDEPETLPSLTRSGYSAYPMLRTPTTEHYVIAGAEVQDEPGAWERLERLYDQHGPSVVLTAVDRMWQVRFKTETGWRMLPEPVGRVAGLVAAMKALSD